MNYFNININHFLYLRTFFFNYYPYILVGDGFLDPTTYLGRSGLSGIDISLPEENPRRLCLFGLRKNFTISLWDSIYLLSFGVYMPVKESRAFSPLITVFPIFFIPAFFKILFGEIDLISFLSLALVVNSFIFSVIESKSEKLASILRSGMPDLKIYIFYSSRASSIVPFLLAKKRQREVGSNFSIFSLIISIRLIENLVY